MKKPNSTLGMRHIALYAKNLTACAEFYTNILAMQIVWQPDEDNIYLSSGHDNLALHRAPQDFDASAHQRLDRLGFFLKSRQDVDDWCQYMLNSNVQIIAKPKDHRDGTRSFYCADPDGNTVQLIYYPI